MELLLTNTETCTVLNGAPNTETCKVLNGVHLTNIETCTVLNGAPPDKYLYSLFPIEFYLVYNKVSEGYQTLVQSNFQVWIH